jgi:hypothetical protein
MYVLTCDSLLRAISLAIQEKQTKVLRNIALKASTLFLRIKRWAIINVLSCEANC